MKILIVFLFLVALGCLAFHFIDGPDSGMLLAAAIFAGLGILAAGYNKLHNGTWFTDHSGGK